MKILQFGIIALCACFFTASAFAKPIERGYLQFGPTDVREVVDRSDLPNACHLFVERSKTTTDDAACSVVRHDGYRFVVTAAHNIYSKKVKKFNKITIRFSDGTAHTIDRREQKSIYAVREDISLKGGSLASYTGDIAIIAIPETSARGIIGYELLGGEVGREQVDVLSEGFYPGPTKKVPGTMMPATTIGYVRSPCTLYQTLGNVYERLGLPADTLRTDCPNATGVSGSALVTAQGQFIGPASFMAWEEDREQFDPFDEPGNDFVGYIRLYPQQVMDAVNKLGIQREGFVVASIN